MSTFLTQFLTGLVGLEKLIYCQGSGKYMFVDDTAAKAQFGVSSRSEFLNFLSGQAICL
jgi:hypothetical protein